MDGSCFPRFRYCVFPVGFKDEFQKMSLIAVPVIISQLTIVMAPEVTLVFCGQIGREQLDAVALAITIMNTLVMATWQGLGNTCDIFFAQAFGSENQNRLGEILQRSLFILMMPCFIVMPILINAEHLLLLLGQDPQISRLAGEFMTIFSSALPAVVFVIVLMKYLQSQGVVRAPVYIGVIGNVLSIGYHAIFITLLRLDVSGGAIALSLCFWTQAILCMLYIKFTGLYRNTWSGWTWACLYGWGEFLGIAIPCYFMTSFEWISWEALTIIAGLLGPVQLGAFSIAYQIVNFLYEITAGFAIATCIRLGNSLGAGDLKSAKTTVSTALRGPGMISMIFCIIVLALHDYIPMAFSSDSEIVALSSDMLYMVAVQHVLHSMQINQQGVIRGTGKTTLGAIIIAVASFGITLPIAVPLMLATDLGVIGGYLAFIISGVFSNVVNVIVISRFNWEYISVQARERVGLTKIAEKSDKSGETNYVTTDHNSERQQLVTQKSVTQSFQHSGMYLNPKPESIIKDSVNSPIPPSLIIKRIASIAICVMITVGGILLRGFLDDISQASTASNTTNVMNVSVPINI